jgi:hypothetical protein
MLENTAVQQLIETQIKSAVDQYVQHILADTDWAQEIENRIVKYVQDRILAKFANMSSMPDLVETVKSSVQTLMTQGHVPGIQNYVDDSIISATVDRSVESFVTQTIDQLSVDPDWLTKIETLINQTYVRKLAERLHEVDITAMIGQHIDNGINRWQDRLLADFKTRGIADLATATELTVMDGTVVVESELATTAATVEKDITVKGTAILNNLSVRGTINTDNKSWQILSDHIADKTLAQISEQWRTDIIDQVLTLAKEQGIEFAQVLIEGNPLINGNALNSAITDSNIQQLGTLRSLSVTGPVNLNNAVNVVGRRLGINTEQPEMALSIWDEEVGVIAGKFSKQTAFVGTSRATALNIGVNRTPSIEIDTDGLTTVKNLRVGRHIYTHAATMPGYSGTRGDIVFNSDPKPTEPFAWQCLGAFRWVPLRSA